MRSSNERPLTAEEAQFATHLQRAQEQANAHVVTFVTK